MNENNLTYCPSGGEHEWEMWYDDADSYLVVDCDNCTRTATKIPLFEDEVQIEPIPVKLDRVQGSLRITPRREV